MKIDTVYHFDIPFDDKKCFEFFKALLKMKKGYVCGQLMEYRFMVETPRSTHLVEEICEKLGIRLEEM